MRVHAIRSIVVSTAVTSLALVTQEVRAGDPVLPGVLAQWGSIFGNPPKGMDRVRDVAGGANATIAIAPSGYVACWGGNGFGERNIPANLGTVVAVAAGYAHMVALRADGSVVCWGAGSSSNTNWPNYRQSIVPAELPAIAQVQAGAYFTMALEDASRRIRIWGRGSEPQSIDEGNVRKISAGSGTVGAVRTDGSLWLESGSVPSDITTVLDLAIGDGHYAVISPDGTVRCWGGNDYGQCDVPQNLQPCVAVAAASTFTMVLQENGIVRAWGNSSATNVPPALSPATAIRAGYGSSFAIQTPDCNGNGLDDAAEIASQLNLDCNSNSRLDACDISLGGEQDVNSNGTPDSCEIDCDNNDLPDSYEISSDPTLDCDHNGTLDSCQPVPPPFNGAQQWRGENGGNNHWYYVDQTLRTHAQAVTFAESVGARLVSVNSIDEQYFLVSLWTWGSMDRAWSGASQQANAAEPGEGWTWNDGTAVTAAQWVPGEPNNVSGDEDVAIIRRSSDGYVIDVPADARYYTMLEWDIADDCNNNGQRDYCEIAAGAPDCNNNGKPDSCDFATAGDCNNNGLLDACEIANGNGIDCNGNGHFDSCDLAAGTSTDLDHNKVPDECQQDCNGNDIPDVLEVKDLLQDCNHDGQLDECQGFIDCDNDDKRDWCETADGSEPDCDHDGQLDRCQLANYPYYYDCNQNNQFDACEIASGSETDCNHNERIDSCDIESDPYWSDCNGNAVLDSCEIESGTAFDCNNNGRIDTCDVSEGMGEDCDSNGVLDSCQKSTIIGLHTQIGPIGYGAPVTIRFPGAPPIIEALSPVCDKLTLGSSNVPGGNLPGPRFILRGDFDQPSERIVVRLGSAQGPVLLTQRWTDDLWSKDGCPILYETAFYESWQGHPEYIALLNAYIAEHRSLDFYVSTTIAVDAAACSGTSWVEVCFSYLAATPADCNGNGMLDTCEIDAGYAQDCEGNRIPDECEFAPTDCDSDGVPDACALAKRLVLDCNGNSIPDGCDIAAGTSVDVDHNGVPDSCKPDCDNDGLPDPYEIASGLQLDCNQNTVPDSCEIQSGLGDCDANGVMDSCEIATGAIDRNSNGIPDSCECLADLSEDSRVDGADLAIVLAFWGNPNIFPRADINHDGAINGGDIGEILNSWGECP
jgi:hypothetical protein